MKINDLSYISSIYSTNSIHNSTDDSPPFNKTAPETHLMPDQVSINLSADPNREDNHTYDLRQMQRTASAIIAQQEQADAGQSSDNKIPVVKHIRGIDVIVENHSRDLEDGSTALRTSRNTSASDYGVDMDVTPGMTVSSTEALTSADVHAYQNINPLTVSTGFSTENHLTTYQLDGLPWEQQYANDVAKYMELIGAERELKALYGQDIKLQYSHADNSYIMLTPDDVGYDHADSAEAGVEWILKDVRNGIINVDQVRNSMSPYGYLS